MPVHKHALAAVGTAHYALVYILQGRFFFPEWRWVKAPFAAGQIWRLLSGTSDIGGPGRRSLSAGLPGPHRLHGRVGADHVPTRSRGQREDAFVPPAVLKVQVRFF